MELTTQDIDVLLEGLEAWESSGRMGEMMGSMFGSMLCGDDEAAREKMKAEQEQRQKELDEKLKVRKERSVVLRAKLIQMRDSMRAGQFVDAATT